MTKGQAAEHKALIRASQSGLVHLVAANGTDRSGAQVYTVPSGTRDGLRFIVRVISDRPISCTCEQWAYRRAACKHMASVWLVTHPGARVRLADGRVLQPATGELVAA